MTKFESLILSVAFVGTVAAAWVSNDRNQKLAEVAESNRLVAEETRELTEAIHENNRILEIIERTE